jgi:hypothetical protein
VGGEVVDSAGRVASKEIIILDLCKSQEFSFEKLKNAMLGPKDIH